MKRYLTWVSKKVQINWLWKTLVVKWTLYTSFRSYLLTNDFTLKQPNYNWNVNWTFRWVKCLVCIRFYIKILQFPTISFIGCKQSCSLCGVVAGEQIILCYILTFSKGWVISSLRWQLSSSSDSVFLFEKTSWKVQLHRLLLSLINPLVSIN